MRAARTGDRTEQDLGLADTRRVCADTQVAREGEFATATEGIAADRGDHRPGNRRHCIERGPERLSRGAGTVLILQLVDVRAGRECLVASRDDDRFDRAIARDFERGVSERTEQHDRQRIHGGTVETQQCDSAVVMLGQDEVSHRSSGTR